MSYTSGMYIEDVNRLSVDILQFDYADLDSSWQMENVCSSFTRIYLIIDGEAEITRNGKKTVLLPGNVYVIPAGVTFSYGCNKNVKKLYIHVAALYDDYYDIFSGFDDFVIIPDMEDEIVALYREYMNKTFTSFICTKAFIYKMLNICFSGKDIKPIKDSQLLINATAYIKGNASSHLTVKKVANELYVSESKLQNEFTRMLGVSVGKYIDECIFRIAESMLISSEIPIREISEKLGFCDQFYFSRFFSKKHGISPQKYRKTVSFDNTAAKH